MKNLKANTSQEMTLQTQTNKKSKKLTKDQLDDALILILNRLIKSVLALNEEHMEYSRTYDAYSKMLHDTKETILKLINE